MIGSLIRNFDFIEVAGQKLPFKFGVKQTEIYCQLTGSLLSEYEKVFADLANIYLAGPEIRALIYSALVDGCRVAKMNVPIDWEDAADLQDWFIQDKAKLFTELLQINIGPNVEGAAKAPEKKKQPEVSETL